MHIKYQWNLQKSSIAGKRFTGSITRNMSARDDRKNINITGILLFRRENFFTRIISITCFGMVIRTLRCSVCIFYPSDVSVRLKFAACQESILFQCMITICTVEVLIFVHQPEVPFVHMKFALQGRSTESKP